MTKQIFLFCLFILTFSGCNKPNPAPEELDQIYLDLRTKEDSAKKAVEDQQKKVDEAREKLNLIVPQTGQNKTFYREYFSAVAELDRLRQKSDYLRVALSSRKFTARAEYMKAFEKGEAWPDSKKFEEYKESERLKSVNKDWRMRYPASDKKPDEKKESAPSGH